jgi:ribosomal protein S18 acetylase RimI-like enzyme
MAAEPSLGIAVRPATTGDIEFMAQLFVLLALQRHPSLASEGAESIARETREVTLDQVQGRVKDSTLYVIELDGQPVGRLRVVRTDEHIEIAGLQVVPDRQGRGIGTAVVKELLHEGMTKEMPVVLEVWKDNPNAKRLYLRLGFEEDEELDDRIRMRVQSCRQG